MSPGEWNQIRFFASHEFDSPDEPGSGVHMQFDLVSRLDALRAELGYPLRINSGIRSAAHNTEVDGVNGSAHVSGFAADIYCRSSRDRLYLLRAAMHLGFHRIGIGTTFIHLDVDPTKPPDVAWLY